VGEVSGRTKPKGGIAAFDRLVWQVMTKEPYRSARRVLWIVGQRSDHRVVRLGSDHHRQLPTRKPGDSSPPPPPTCTT
jgi:hypothetical protein